MAIRREHAGGAAQADLQSSINAAALSFQVQSGQGAGYPTGGTGPFVIALGRGSSTEEKVLCASRSGDVFTVTTRGYDNTLAVDHSVPTVVDHVLGAIEIDEANAHLMASTAQHGVAGALVGTTDAQTLTNKTIAGGSNTISGVTPAMLSLGANWAAALAAALDTDVATVLGAMHSSWVTPLNTALDADAASLLANIANSWVAVLQTALGTNWATALSATLDTDSRTVLGAMGTGWPAILGAAPGSNWAAALAAALDSDTQTVLASGGMGTGWPATLAAAISGLRPQESASSSNGTSSDSPPVASSAGLAQVGHSFTAPPSGNVFITVSAYLYTSINNEAMVVGRELRTGATVGAGTVVEAYDDDSAVIIAGNVETGVPLGGAFSMRSLQTGLTAGSSYNVRTMHGCSPGGGGNIEMRKILTEPVL